MTKSKGIAPPRRPWTEEDLQLLRDLYPDVPCSAIAQTLGRSNAAVYSTGKKLGLAKSAEFLASEHSGRVQRGKQHPAMVASQFPKGIVPWNKGKRICVSPNHTWFQPGHVPATWLPLGSVRFNKRGGYLERKVREGNYGALNWEAVHRLVWKEAHGPIPEGHMVAFKGRKPITVLEEITPDALECITKAENMRRNTIWRKDPEVAALYQVKGQITRQVNRIQKESQSS